MHMRQLNRWFFILLFFTFFIFLFISGKALAETSFKVFQTQQPAQNLIPSSAPLYGQSAKFTAKNNQLIVKASEPILIEIEQLLNEIDQPLQNLLIEVSSSLTDDGNFQANNIGYNTLNSNFKAIHTRRRNSNKQPDLFTIRTIEGQWSTIETGQRVPYYTQGGLYSPWQSTTELVDVISGFDVFPIINGDQVILKIRPHNNVMDSRYPDRINTRSLDTSITGTLGEWIFLGGAINKLNSKNINSKLGYKNNELNVSRYSTRKNSDLETRYSIRINTID